MELVVNAGEKRELVLVHSSSESAERVVRLIGEGAQVVVSEFFLSGKVRSSLTVVHEASNTVSRVVSKGVVRNDDVGAFAKIVVPRTSLNCDSFVSQKFLLLGDGVVDALPSLVVEASDVKAGHSSAICEVDESVLFYLVSRGLSEADARNLIVEGFLGLPEGFRYE